ncbi:MAG: patatin-like phospholipase family protein [Alkalispirochaetaceae bacterium]
MQLRFSQKPVGLALGGGGARGMAHVGVLRTISRYPRFRPTIIAGTSAGAVIGALYAGGLSQERLEQIVMDLDWFSHIIRLGDMIAIKERQKGGLFPNSRLGELVNEELEGRSFSDLDCELLITATDVENRRRVIFTAPRTAERLDRRTLERFLPPPRRGRPGIETLVISDVADVGLAVRASAAVPGAFQPVEVRGMRLLDGGLVDQTPVDLVQAAGARLTIGVSLGLSFMPSKMNNLMSAISATVGTLGVHQLWRSLEAADIGFEVEGIQGRSPVKPKQIDLIHMGERDADRWLGEFSRRPTWLPRLNR